MKCPLITTIALALSAALLFGLLAEATRALAYCRLSRRWCRNRPSYARRGRRREDRVPACGKWA